jgi:hypothetical protein
MRTFILVCLVALIVTVGMAFATGLVSVASEHRDAKYIITCTVDTAMIHPLRIGNFSTSHGEENAGDQLVEVKGKITAVRPDKNEFVVSENVKNWTFELARDGRIFINDRDGKLSELQAGDDVAVTFDRREDKLLATRVHATRK